MGKASAHLPPYQYGFNHFSSLVFAFRIDIRLSCWVEVPRNSIAPILGSWVGRFASNHGSYT